MIRYGEARPGATGRRGCTASAGSPCVRRGEGLCERFDRAGPSSPLTPALSGARLGAPFAWRTGATVAWGSMKAADSGKTGCGRPGLCWALGAAGFALATAAAGPVSAQTGASPLADAAKRQDGAALRALLRDGADVDRPQGDGATALHWAAYRDDVETVRLLLASGAAVDPVNVLGVTPLWLAANNGSPAVVEVLLAAGAGPNRALPSGEMPLMTASRTGRAAAVRALLARRADPHAREHAHEQTALMWAAAQGHPEVVRLLLAAGARVDDRSLVYPQVVSSSGNADRSGVFEVMQGGYTPLLFAARRGDVASARLLVAAGAGVDTAAASGTSPLVVAAHSGHGALGAFLLSAGADPGAADAGYAALHAAVLRGDLPLVRALLVHGADPDAVLERGTPARRVSADWRLPHNMIGATPLWVAARFREPAILRVLAEYGADPSHEVGGETVLMAAIQGGSNRGRFGIAPPNAEEEARRTLESVTAALDAGADLDARNGNGDTVLHIAASRGLDDVVALLAARDAALDDRNENGQTPLGLASGATAVLLAELGATDGGAEAAVTAR